MQRFSLFYGVNIFNFISCYGSEKQDCSYEIYLNSFENSVLETGTKKNCSELTTFSQPKTNKEKFPENFNYSIPNPKETLVQMISAKTWQNLFFFCKNKNSKSLILSQNYSYTKSQDNLIFFFYWIFFSFIFFYIYSTKNSMTALKLIEIQSKSIQFYFFAVRKPIQFYPSIFYIKIYVNAFILLYVCRIRISPYHHLE